MRSLRPQKHSAFTLIEMLVSVAVLILLILIVSRLMNTATAVTTIGSKHMDADNQARPFLDRMAVDFSQIVKRADVDYFLKQPSNPQTGSGNTGKNDQLAFYGTVPGYYPSTGSQSPVSLVAYRVNAKNQVERMGKGLLWNGVTPPSSPTPTPAPMVFLPLTIATTWPAATTNATDSDYEVVGPQIFRFEYYYQLQQGDLSDTPWDTNLSHTKVAGLQDVGAIIVVIATIDPKSRVLISDAQLTTLAGQMQDYVHYNSQGQSGKVGPQPQVQWQKAVDDAVKNSVISQAAGAGIHFYQRYIYLNGEQQ